MTGFDPKALGERIAYYRHLNGLSAAGLAEKSGAGLTRDIVANIENGRRKDISASHLIAIAEALRVPISVLALPLNRPIEKVSEGRTVLDVLSGFQGWNTEGSTPAELEALAQLAAIRVYLQLKAARDDALYSLAFHSDGAEARARQETLDEAQTALDAQLTVLRRLGIELPDDG